MVAVVVGNGLGLSTSSASVLGSAGLFGQATVGRGQDMAYVNVANGNLVVQRQDEFLVGRGPDIDVVRTYNSGATFDFDNNDSWQLSLYRKLSLHTGPFNAAGSTIVRSGADGAQTLYTYDVASGKYVNKDGGGAYDTLSYSSAVDTWTWCDGDTQIQETYQAKGDEWRITGQRDLGGNTLTYTYNESTGLIEQVADANGEITTLSYNASKQLLRVEVSTGGVTTIRVRYTYDDQNRLSKVKTDLTPEDNSIGDGNTYVTTYAYDDRTNGAGVTVYSNRIATIVNSDGTQVSFHYDDSFRVSQVVDGAGQITEFIYGVGKTTVKDPLQQANIFTYAATGNLEGVQGPGGQDIRYEYDGDGNPIQSTDSRGNTVTYRYDGHGNQIHQQDSAGNGVDRVYNNANQLTKETVYAIPDPDGAGGAPASVPQTTYYIRDGYQHLRFVVSPEGRVTEYRYNGVGQTAARLIYTADAFTVGSTDPTLTDLTNWLATLADKTKIERTDYTYDDRGLMRTATGYASTNTSGGGVAGTKSTTRYIYDAAGLLRQRIDPRGEATSGIANDYLTAYAYDGLGRTTAITQYDAAGTASRQTEIVFTDPTNRTNRTKVTLANGLKRVSLYDARGLLVSQVEQSGATTLSTQTYQYDADGQLRISTDANGNKTYYLYNDAGRKVGEIDPTGGLTEWVYDSAGLVIKTIRYARAVTANLATLFTVDATGIVADIAMGSVRPATSGADQVTRRLYDAAGRLRFSVDARGYVTETRYDGAGRMLATLAYANILSNAAGLDSLGREAVPSDLQLLTTAPTGGQIGLQLNAGSDRASYHFYDDDGLLCGTLDGEGYLTEFRYDTAGQRVQTVRYAMAIAPAQVKSALAADLAQRADGALAALLPLANTTPANNIQAFAWYNGLGQTVGRLDGENYYTAYTYDAAGNLAQTTRYANRLVGTAVAGTPPQVVTSTPGSVPTGGYVRTNAQDQTTRNTWTAFNQLDSETAVDGTRSQYTYDSLGGRLTTVVAAGATDSRTVAARYDLQGRLVQELSALGAAALAALGAAPSQAQVDAIWAAYGTTYAYDAAGRRIRSTDANGNVTLYFYDAANRLTYTVRRVKNPANANQWQGEVSQRQYNALGQVTAEVRYANRIVTAKFNALTGGADAQVKAAGVIVADAANDSRTDYTYIPTGELARSTVKLNAGENAIIDRGYNAFGQLATLKTALDTRTRQEQLVYDRRGLLVTDKQDVVWASNADATGVQVLRGYDAFGRMVRYTDGNNVVSTTQYDKLGRQIQTVSGGGLNLTRKATYDAFGRVLTQTDALGKVTTYGYAIDSAAGRTTLTVTSPEGIVTRSVTDRYGQTLTVVDGLGNETRYTYDANGNLKTRARWDKAADAETVLETDTYDTAGLRLVETRDANGYAVAYTYDAADRLLTRTVDPDGLDLVTTYAYDAKGQTISVTDPNGIVTQTTYDLGGRVILVAVDPTGLNLRTQYVYDLTGNQLSVIEGYGTDGARTTEYRYDSLGRRTQTVVDPGGLALTTTYAYDKNDNLVTRVEAAGTPLARTTRYSYDTANRLVYTVDALGGVTRNDYDAEGHVIQSTAYAKAIDLTGLATNATVAAIAGLISANSLDRSTRYAYDKDGRLVFTRVARDGATDYVSENVYNAAGKVVQVITYANPVARSTGNTVAAIRATLVASADDRGIRTVYDAQDRARFTLDALGHVTENRYDPAGNLDRTVAYAHAVTFTGNPTEAEVEGALVLDHDADQSTVYEYDAAGRLRTLTDALGQVEAYTYDAVGNRTGRTDKRGNTWTYTYDHAGRLTHEYSPVVPVTRVQFVNGQATAVTEDASIVTYMTYDALGNVKTRTEAYGAPEARTTTYGYDTAGRQITVSYPPVGVYDASRDWAGNGVKNDGTNEGAVSRSETTQSLSSTTTYDALGNATVNLDVGGQYSYKVYDPLGRVLYELDAEHYLTAYTYDAFGNTLTVTRYAQAVDLAHTPGTAYTADDLDYWIGRQGRPAGDDRTLTYGYDTLNRLVQTSQAKVYAYDSSTGRAFTASPTTRNTYNAFGQVVRQSSLVDPGADNTEGTADDTWLDTYFYYYDVKGQKTAQVDALGYVTAYQYDGNGNLTRTVEYAQALAAGTWSVSGYAAPTSKTPATATAASAIGFDRVTRIDYDGLNRKIAEVQEGVQYSVPTSGAAATAKLGDLATRYGYDAVGNLVSTTDPTGAVTHLYYDALGRTLATAEPARITESGGTTAMPPLTVAETYLDIGPIETVQTTTQGRSTYSPAVSLSWSDLGIWGEGPARVLMTYEYGIASLRSTSTQTQALSTAEAAHGTTVVIENRWAPNAITRVQLQKEVGGTWVTVLDSTADTAKSSQLVWDAPAIEGTLVTLEYRPQGSTGAWTTATVNGLGDHCWVDASGLVPDRYEYRLSYVRPGESTPYAQGTGVFALSRGTGTGRNVVAETVTPYLDIGQINKAQTGTTYTATVDLAWNDLNVWGSGAAQVVVNYGYNGTITQTQALSAAEAAHGATLTLSSSSATAITRVQVQKQIGGTWVTVLDSTADVVRPAQLVLRGKTGGLSGITVYNADGAQVGTYTPTSLGGGIYVADVSGLAPGNYTYVPVGTTSALGGRFTVNGVTGANRVQVREQSAYLDIGPVVAVENGTNSDGDTTYVSMLKLAWNDLGVWGDGAAQVVVYSYNGAVTQTQALSAAEAAHGVTLALSQSSATAITRVQVQKQIAGTWVTVLDSTADTQAARLEFSSLPAAAASVTLEYRPVGDTGPYLVKPASTLTKLGSGWFGVAYDDIANGNYEYRLTVTNTNGNLVNLTALGGTAQGTLSGSFSVLRGGQDLSTASTSTAVHVLTPLTTFEHDIYGNVVHTTRYADGAAMANADGYAPAGLDAEGDQHTYTVYDRHGHAAQTVDGEGASVYFSYDAYGHVAKRWQPVLDNDVRNHNTISYYRYDGLGRQTATEDVVNTTTRARTEVQYNAFGEIVAKGHNSTTAPGTVDFLEFAQYDQAGRVLRSNADSGVTQAFLYDLQGRVTATVTGQTLDLANAAYATPQAVAGLSQGVQRTDTVYDALGHVVRQTLPAYTVDQAPDAIPSPLTVAETYLDIGQIRQVRTATDAWGNNPTYGLAVDLTWNDLGVWGNGAAQVVVNYGYNGTITQTQALSAAETAHGVTLALSQNNVTTLTRVQVQKQIGGTWVTVLDSTADTAKSSQLVWDAPAIEGTLVTLEYRPQGSTGAWTTATVNGLGDHCWVDASGLAPDRYEYRLSYARPGESTPYAQGTGVFALSRGTGTGRNVVAETVTPYLDIGQIHQVRTGTDAWGNNPTYGLAVDLTWSDLGVWGSGAAQVVVNYGYNGTITQTQALSAAEAAHGTTLALSQNNVTTITRVQVQKQIGGTWVTVLDSTADVVRPTQLVLRGKTGGLSGITVYNADGAQVGTYTPTSLGGGIYVADVNGLAPGTYTYVPVGTTSALGGRFTVNGVTGANRVQVREQATYLDIGQIHEVRTGTDVWGNNPTYGLAVDLAWSDLGVWGSGAAQVLVTYGWGYNQNTTQTQALSAAEAAHGVTLALSQSSATAITRVQVQKQIAGTWVTVLDSTADTQAARLEFSSLPAAAASVTLEYRPVGDTGPYLVKPASTLTKLGSGWFGVAYDDIANGNYEYRLTVTNTNGNLVNLTALGGTAQGTLSGSFSVLRGGQDLSTTTAQLATLTPTVTRTFDRWGNVLSVTDPTAAGRLTQYRYNRAGQVIEMVQPTTDIWTAAGVDQRNDANAANDRPTTRYAYDAAGRLLAVTDANGKVNGYRYDEAGQQVGEIHADGGRPRLIYDALGRKIASIDANGNQTTYAYDRNDRQTRITTALNETTTYTYDQAGRQIRVLDAQNALDPAHPATAYFYDRAGNLVRTRQPLGQETTATYDLQNRKTSEQQGGVAHPTATWTYDYFGRLANHTDLGGTAYTYRYDQAGNLVWQTNTLGQDLRYTYYENGLVKTLVDAANASETFYEYDLAGRRTRERFRITQNGVTTTAQDTRIRYDELGRIATLQDNRYDVTYSYDAVGNRRHTVANYYDAANAAKTVDYWYTYDGMNRILISQGTLNGSSIGINSSQGTSLGYDAGGNRRVATSYANGSQVTESYTYDFDNHLKTTSLGGQLTSAREYDKVGRVIQYTNYSSPGVMSDQRVITYNANGWTLTQLNYDAGNTLIARVRYNYADSYDALGNVTHYSVEGLTGTTYTYNYTKTYQGFEAYREKTVHGTMTVNYSGGAQTSTGDTTSTYDVNGNLTRVVDTLATDTTRSFVVNAQGQVLRKTEGANSEYYFYANGNPVGSTGGTAADFDYNYTPVSDAYPASTPGSYLVNAGDTLQSVALAMFGDAGLWYLIADANGLVSADLSAYVGKTLTIPNRITNLHNDATTFKPYNPSAIVGDTTPTVPTPPPPAVHGGGCGGAQIIVAIVAVVATVMTAGAASSTFVSLGQTWTAGINALGMGATEALGADIGAAMLGGMVGSVAGQLTGMALGVQDEFSWGAVAAGAIGSAVGTSGIVAKIVAPISEALKLEAFGQAAVAGAVGSVINQGVNIMTGQQQSFSWAGVAAGAISAPISQAISTKFGGNVFAAQAVTSLASEAVNSALTGSRFSWSSVAANAVTGYMRTDAFGNLLGNLVVDAMQQDTAPTQLDTGATPTAESPQPEAFYDDPNWKRSQLAGPVMFDDNGQRITYPDEGSLAGAMDQVYFHQSNAEPTNAKPIDVVVLTGVDQRQSEALRLMDEFIKNNPNADSETQQSMFEYYYAQLAVQAGIIPPYTDIDGKLCGPYEPSPQGGQAEILAWSPYDTGLRGQMLQGMETILGDSPMASAAISMAEGLLYTPDQLFALPNSLIDLGSSLLEDPLGTLHAGQEALHRGYVTLMSDTSAGANARASVVLSAGIAFTGVGMTRSVGWVEDVANEAAAIHPGRLAAESADVSRESLLRALRQADTPESLATAKLLSRGKLDVNILPSDPSGRGLGGLYRFGTNEIDIYGNAFSTTTEAAGYATHEATHFMQGLSRSNYNLGHEFDAFRAQGAVDYGHWTNRLSDPGLYDLLSTHPVYRGVPPAP